MTTRKTPKPPEYEWVDMYVYGIDAHGEEFEEERRIRVRNVPAEKSAERANGEGHKRRKAS